MMRSKKKLSHEAAPLLWKQIVIHTIPGTPTRAYKYGIPIRMDEKSRALLSVEYTWLTLVWFLEKPRRNLKSAGTDGIWLPTATCKVMIHGIDDTNYGAWLTKRSHHDFMETWYALRAFLWINNAKEYGVNGENLMEYSDTTLGAYERDYN